MLTSLNTFWIIGTLMIIVSIMMVESRKLVHYITFLFIFIILTAAIFILTNAIIIGIAELIIYNGGIVVLLAISISLYPDEEIVKNKFKYIVVIPIILIVLLGLLLYNYNPSLNFSN